MTLTGAQIIWESLLREGVTDVFGYPGGAILPAYDAMRRAMRVPPEKKTKPKVRRKKRR